MRTRRRSALVSLAAAAAISVALAACSGPEGGESAQSDAAASGFSTSALAPSIATLGTSSAAPAPTTRLARGLVPPTNRWFSGLVFGDAPEPVFATPISYQVTDGGFAAGLPAVSAVRNTISGAAVAQFGLDLGATSMRVSAYDQVSVTVAHLHGGAVVGHSTIAEGSPIVAYTAASSQTVRPTADIARTSSTTGTLVGGGQEWVVVVAGGAIAASGASIRLDRAGSVSAFPAPAGASASQIATLAKAARSPLASVALTRAATASRQRTVLAYRTVASGDTLLVPQRSQGTAGITCSGLRYDTIDGALPVCVGSALRFSVPTVDASASLDLGGLSAADRAELRTQVRADAATITASSFATDSYMGGKTLYRAANLYTLARQLGMRGVASSLRTATVAVLDHWGAAKGCLTRDDQCFAYDETVKGIIGQQPSYGSDQFNDHHFHYGYILFAAGVMAKGHPALVARWKDALTLVAADIAAPVASSSFPEQRTYDPYAQHSWASGYAPFGDGNNQESTSEAVNAWNGLAAWASAAHDDALEREATWLLSNEAAAALDDSIAPDLSAKAFGAADITAFDHDMVSLTWGGKRDFATWFSAEHAAPAGIELIPMSPVSATYLSGAAGGGAAHIRRVVDAATPGGFSVQFGDYLLMYRSLASAADAREALATARALPAADIDNADSRSYLLAFIMTRT